MVVKTYFPLGTSPLVVYYVVTTIYYHSARVVNNIYNSSSPSTLYNSVDNVEHRAADNSSQAQDVVI